MGRERKREAARAVPSEFRERLILEVEPTKVWLMRLAYGPVFRRYRLCQNSR
jgi:hypothetical protein